MKIAINSHTSGKFRTETLNNREHLVTDMVPIVCDSVMNQGLYPRDEVVNTIDQMNFLPTPSSHPSVGGALLSAHHPVAVNAHGMGGFTRNPRLEGDKVMCEFWLDTEVANRTPDGIETIRRIKTGEPVGVSTGLTVNKEPAPEGVEDYDWIARNMQYDHVAILLNEEAAGAHVGTELVLNDAGVLICNAEDAVAINADHIKSSHDTMTAHDIQDELRTQARSIWPEELFFLWVAALFPLDNTIVFNIEARADSKGEKFVRLSFTVNDDGTVTLGSDAQEVRRGFIDVGPPANITTQPEEGVTMNAKTKGADASAEKGGDGLTVEAAVNLLEEKGFTVNKAGEGDSESLKFFTENKPQIEAMINRQAADEKEARDKLVTNSELEEDDVKSMSIAMVNKLLASVEPVQTYGMTPGGRAVANASDEDEVDYGPNYDEQKEG